MRSLQEHAEAQAQVNPPAVRPGDPITLENGTYPYSGGDAARVEEGASTAEVAAADRAAGSFGTEGDIDVEKQWYQPAHSLGNHSVILKPGKARLLSSAGATRKFAAIRNNSAVDPFYVGDSEEVTVTAGPHAGTPVDPGTERSYDAHEYDGDLWGITSGAAADVDVRVQDPRANQ